VKRAIIGLIVLVILVVGGILIFHKSPSYQSNNTNSNQSSKTPNQATQSNSVVLVKTSPAFGQYLTDPSGRALYTYNADTSGVSNCTGSCLSNWPIYQATGSTTNLPANIGTIKRTDSGQTQYTYNGLPLYYFTGDSGSQVTGNGIDNFSIAKASSTSSGTSNSSTTNNSNSSGYPY